MRLPLSILGTSVLFAGCGGMDESTFNDKQAEEICDYISDCEGTTWETLDLETCLERNQRWEVDDPCVTYDETAARACLKELRKLTCDAEIWDAEACNEVYVWESENCDVAIGFVGVRRSGTRRRIRRRLRA